MSATQLLLDDVSAAAMDAVVFGIDPGAHGAIAVISAAGQLLDVIDMPSTPEANGRTATNAPLLAGILARWQSALKRLRAACRPSQAWRMWSPSNVWSCLQAASRALVQWLATISQRKTSSSSLSSAIQSRSCRLPSAIARRCLASSGIGVCAFKCASPASTRQVRSNRPRRDRRRACEQIDPRAPASGR